jgi:hypothetical protein
MASLSRDIRISHVMQSNLAIWPAQKTAWTPGLNDKPTGGDLGNQTNVLIVGQFECQFELAKWEN